MGATRPDTTWARRGARGFFPDRVPILAVGAAAGLALAPAAYAQTTVHSGSTIIQDSLCVGVDCTPAESFGFDTVRLKENNLRIKFEDTSSTGAFPSNDWSIVVNDSVNGGNAFFAIVDETAGATLLKLCAVADASCTEVIPGTGAKVGTTNTSQGTGSSATGEGSTAFGSNARAERFDTAIGFNSQVTADGSVAVGANTTVNAPNSVAVGADAQVLAGASGAVALGQGSIASEPNTVSVGTPTSLRRITNVGRGTNPFDAVNMQQFRELDDRVDDVGAISAAFSALVPAPRGTGDTQVALGVGTYSGSQAVAGGVFHHFNDNLFLNAGVSVSGNGDEVAGRAGMTFSW